MVCQPEGSKYRGFQTIVSYPKEFVRLKNKAHCGSALTEFGKDSR